MLNEEPGRNQLSHFRATDANTRTMKTRGMGYFPFEVLAPLLGAELTARQAFELVVPSLIDAGLDVTCSSLVDFLTVALIQPTEDDEAPLTVHVQAGKAGHLPGPLAIITGGNISSTGIFLLSALLQHAPTPATQP
jgi:hypothetical protein